jgi:8-oxo-dGTP pyrophosphatase MutT (NUDIX family)
MGSLGPGKYVVVVVLVVGSKAFDIKLVLQREPRNDKTCFPACSIFSNEAPVDVAVRELFEEIGLSMAVDDLTLLSGNHDKVLVIGADLLKLLHVLEVV